MASIRTRQTFAGTTYGCGPPVKANAVVTVWAFDAATDSSQTGTAIAVAAITRRRQRSLRLCGEAASLVLSMGQSDADPRVLASIS